MSKMKMHPIKPNLFLVGAWKSGTTAMATYLSEHPDIFVARKELHFFGEDIPLTSDRLSKDDYLYFFRDARDQRYLCDASVGYLRSEVAADEIHAFNSEARILIMLRDPVDWMFSYHRNLVFAGIEPLRFFSEALDAEADRQAGRRLPPRLTSARQLLYRENADFAPQVRRYLDRFGAQRTLVIIYEEFASDPGSQYRRVLKFLDLPDDARTEFPTINSGARRVRSESLSRIVRHPPPALRRIARFMVPSRRIRLTLGGRLIQKVIDLNTAVADRDFLAADLRTELHAALTDQIKSLEELLGRPLPWGATQSHMTDSKSTTTSN
jgi:hypothetical protein